jgi:hypothetical protein
MQTHIEAAWAWFCQLCYPPKRQPPGDPAIYSGFPSHFNQSAA